MSDASVLINTELRKISSKMGEGVFEVTLDYEFLRTLYANLSEAQNKAMVMEGKHLCKCEDCGRIIQSCNVQMMPSGRVVPK